MFTLYQNSKEVLVSFDKKGDLRDAPTALFTKKEFGSMKEAKEAAIKYGEAHVDLFKHTKNLSMTLKAVPELLRNNKINFQIDNVTNKTGVVGVYLENKYDRLGRKSPYAYTANFWVNGTRVLKRFPINKSSAESAFNQAVSYRLLALNLNRDLLQRQI